MKKFLYRNQYLITDFDVDIDVFKKYASGKYNIYYHEALNFSKIEKEKIYLYLLGDIFDFNQSEKDNHEILKDLWLCLKESFNKFIN